MMLCVGHVSAFHCCTAVLHMNTPWLTYPFDELGTHSGGLRSEPLQIVLRTPQFTAQGGHAHTLLLGTLLGVKLLARSSGLLGGDGSIPAYTHLAGCLPDPWAWIWREGGQGLWAAKQSTDPSCQGSARPALGTAPSDWCPWILMR